MIEKVKSLIRRHAELEKEMSSPEVTANPKKLEALGREYNDLGRSLPLLREYVKLSEELRQAHEIIENEKDPDMLELARGEIESIEEHQPELERKVQLILVPKDPNDTKNAIVEIRAGTGGVEAGLFAGDLLRMY
ncbi:MAG: PCRF domain-containing protein, partial [Chitinivibrionales bacterium]|nr:PCRF domain-containing protein [Chitinivibrionales bacterium]MBD3357147.1 PCRF domain-containing protein [Chitinivibrionales bacterium]